MSPSPCSSRRYPDSLPRLSVVVPFYNQQDLLAEALKSVLAQRYPNLEILVVDDGSQEGDLSWVEALGDELKLLRQENAGPAAARNHGIREASGEILAFIDSDDLWPNDKLLQQIAPLVEDQRVDVVMSKVSTFSESVGRSEPSLNRSEEDSFYTIQLGCMLVRKRVFEQIGLFDESLIYSEDQDWFLRAREADTNIVKLDTEGLFYRKHGESLTRRSSAQADYGLIHILKRSLDRRRKGAVGEPRALLSLSDLREWESLS